MISFENCETAVISFENCEPFAKYAPEAFDRDGLRAALIRAGAALPVDQKTVERAVGWIWGNACYALKTLGNFRPSPSKQLRNVHKTLLAMAEYMNDPQWVSSYEGVVLCIELKDKITNLVEDEIQQ